MRATAHSLLLSFSLSLLLAGASRAQECIDYRDYPHLAARFDWSTTSSGAVALAGNHAYVSISSLNEGVELRVIDISNPSTPAIVGDTSVLQAGLPIDGLTVAGSLAYMTVGSFGIQIVDISNPESPSVVGGIDTPARAYEVAVDGTHAYIADGASGLQVVDVSNPASPVLVGSLDTIDARGIAVAGGYAYIADLGALSRLLVIDISNPVSPMLAGSVAVPSQVEDVAIDGTHAYVACREAGVRAVDISNPALPELRGFYNNGQWTTTVTVAEGRIYVCGSSLITIL